MQFDGRKSKASAVSLLLLFAMAVSLVGLPTANAQGTMKTYPFIGATPNPVGVGQETLLHVGITHQLGGVQYGWEGLSVTIEKPDGTTETLTGIRTDATGGTGRVYIPTMVGNYTLQTHFPEQEMPVRSAGTPAGTVMLASESEKLTLVVQEEQIEYYPSAPLPTEYWTRPIDAQLREWNVIAGSWLMLPENKFAPYNDYAPETAHVLWTTPLNSGGLAGGEMGDHSFSCGDAYEGKWPNSIILAGRLYYQMGGSRGIESVVYHCVDLHTGKELWSKAFLDNRTISFGQMFYWDSYNYHAVFPYLWVTVGNTWYAFDAYTGDWRFTVENVPAVSSRWDPFPLGAVMGPKGEIFVYDINLEKGWMALWNMSALGSMGGSWGNSVHGRTLDAAANTTAAQRAWSWNVSIPTDLPGRVRAIGFGDRVIGASYSTTEVTSWGLSLKPGQEGTVLFKKTWNAPAEWAEGNQSITWSTTSFEDGVFTLMTKETRQHFGFSADSGEFLWATEPENYMNIYTAWGATYGRLYVTANIAYGKLFSAGMSGIVYCFDVETGELLWSYDAYDPLNEILWSNNWPLFQAFATDGKVYLFHTEHSPVDPKPRGAPFICLNATTGEEIWRVDGLLRGTWWGGWPIIGDSIIATYETYDQRVYAIGKGPSATTVTAAPEISVHGSNVLVKGMVTDISPGTEEYALTARFPNGVPAVCDENMSEWMVYVYKQFPRPADVVGVEVVLEVLDPNNNFYEVGRTTTDASGGFKLMFTPEVPGEYTIIATFEGSESYWPSYAQTYLGVEEAPAATPAPTPTPAPMTDMYVTGFGIGIIIAIAVVGLLLFMMLRRR